jgi:hypothetical protein
MPNVFGEGLLPHQQPEQNAHTMLRDQVLAGMRHGQVVHQGGAPARHRRRSMISAEAAGSPVRHTPLRGQDSFDQRVSRESPNRLPAGAPMTPQHAMLGSRP